MLVHAHRHIVTVRDLLAWVEFVCHTTSDSRPEIASDSPVPCSTLRLDLSAAYVHGACIVFVDALTTSGHFLFIVVMWFLIVLIAC